MAQPLRVRLVASTNQSLSMPALATVAPFQFVAAWNEFHGPLLYLSEPARFSLAYGPEQFVSSYSTQTNLLMAAAIPFTLPIMALFFLTQRTFLKGIATTGSRAEQAVEVFNCLGNSHGGGVKAATQLLFLQAVRSLAPHLARLN